MWPTWEERMTKLVEADMPITRFLPGPHFDPETVSAMSRAYRSACRKLGLGDRNDSVIANHVIELARAGTRNPTTLYRLTVEKFSVGRDN
jgi:hypothetical protein